MEKIPPLSELFMALRRHSVKLVAIIILGMIGSIIYALNQPRTYQTAAMVQILQPAVAETISHSTSSGAILQRLQLVEQKLMARDNIIKIINKHDLYPGLTISEKVLRLRLATQIEKIQDQALRWRSDISPTALMIRVTDGDPKQTALIANEFVESLLAQSRASSAAKAREALVFFESERARVGEEIAELDGTIAKFKQKNSAVMPAGQTSLRSELVTINASALRVESELLNLRSEIANVQNIASASKLQRLEEQFALLDGKRQIIEAQLARGPEVEREFVALTRKLQQLTDQYNIINTNRAEAEMGQMLEASRQSSNFEVLETALVPQHPVAPNRKKITLTGIAFSIAAALALIVFLELWKPVIRNSSQLLRRHGINPVIAIPTLQVPRVSFFNRTKMYLKGRITNKT